MVGRFIWRRCRPRLRGQMIDFGTRIEPLPLRVRDEEPLQTLRDSEGRAWAVNATPWPE